MRTIGIVEDEKVKPKDSEKKAKRGGSKKPNSGKEPKTGDKPEGTGATENVEDLESAEKE